MDDERTMSKDEMSDVKDMSGVDQEQFVVNAVRTVIKVLVTYWSANDEFTLPSDISSTFKDLITENARRQNGENGMDTDSQPGAVWNHDRTAKMINRAVEKSLPGVTAKPAGVPVTNSLKFNGSIAAVPRAEAAEKFIRLQAVAYDENRKLDGSKDASKAQEPVENACKMEWFQLPKGYQLDFGKAEPVPGYKFDLGDPVKCGCERGTISQWQKRQMFYKILESLAIDFNRLTLFNALIAEEFEHELKDDNGDVRQQLSGAVADLGDISAMLCNRASALFYITCQHLREHVLQASGLRGFTKNYLRLAHASQTLFKSGETDKMNVLIKRGVKKFPKPLPNCDFVD